MGALLQQQPLQQQRTFLSLSCCRRAGAREGEESDRVASEETGERQERERRGQGRKRVEGKGGERIPAVVVAAAAGARSQVPQATRRRLAARCLHVPCNTVYCSHGCCATASLRNRWPPLRSPAAARVRSSSLCSSFLLPASDEIDTCCLDGLESALTHACRIPTAGANVRG